MKQLFIIILFMGIFSVPSFAQLNKGIWLVGGSGKFSYLTDNYIDEIVYDYSNNINIDLNSNIGYFLKDRWVLGLKPGISSYKNLTQKDSKGNSIYNTKLTLGLFSRYYFLKEYSSKFNVIIDASYKIGSSLRKPYKSAIIKGLDLNGGAVAFLNNSISLEFLAGYFKQIEDAKNSFKREQSGFQVVVGFQVHIGN